MPTLPVESRPPLAYHQLLERCLGNVEFAQRILAKFLSRFDEDFGKLVDGVSAKDGETVALIAHRLKGSSANIAAEELARVMNDIERLGRHGDWGAIEAKVEEGRREWSRFADHVKTLGQPSG